MKTLVLNKSWEPESVIGWQRAVSLVYTGRAEIVEENSNKIIHSVTSKMEMPSVIRLLSPRRSRKAGAKYTKNNVYLRDRGCCQYCGINLPKADATLDHVLPRALGGKTSWKNTVIACRYCNGRKGDKMLQDCGLKLRKQPVQPETSQIIFSFIVLKSQECDLSWRNYFNAQP
jgi:5-methylcytosine-specific restriction endonuclease McrA